MNMDDCNRDDVLSIAKRVLKTEADAVFALIDKLNGHFEKAIEIMYNAKGRVVVTGMGKSGLIGKKIAATLASTGTPAFFLHPAEAIHGDVVLIRLHAAASSSRAKATRLHESQTVRAAPSWRATALMAVSSTSRRSSSP